MSLADPKLLAQTEDLEIIARWVVEGFLHGLHKSPYVGFSVEFASHRQYLPGDDLRHLNWKLYGRHDKLYVKQYDAETNVELRLLVDVSRSMTVGDPLTKLQYASMLCASLAHLAGRQRDAVGVTLFADHVLEHLRPRGSLDHRMDVLRAMSQPREHPPAQTASVLHEAAELAARRGLVVLASDLYFEPDELLDALSHFRHAGHDVLVFHILTSLERGLNVDGSAKFVDVETGEQIVTQSHEIRASFVAAVEEWIATLQGGCLSREIEYVPITTDTPLETALFDYFVKRSHLY